MGSFTPAGLYKPDAGEGGVAALLNANWDLLDPSVGLLIRKAIIETVNTNNTLQDDNELKFLVVANAIYFFEGFLIVTAANTTMDFQAGWSYPAGTTMQWGVLAGVGRAGFSSEATGTTANALKTQSDALTFGSMNGTFGVSIAGVIVVGGTPGTMQFKWAQNTSDGGNLSVQPNSFIMARRIA